MATKKSLTLSERFKAFRTMNGFSQEQTGKLLGVTGDFISQIENGRRDPGGSLVLLFEMLESSPLYKGGDNATSQPPDSLAEKPAIYRSSNPQREVPIISWAQAGSATDFEELPRDECETVPYFGRDDQAFALRIEGDSMEPKFPPGTIIIVSPKHPPTNGNLVVAKIKGQGVLFKVFHHSGDGRQITLTSYNPVFPPLILARENFHWIWRVVESRNQH